jgi:hypothetical protein
VKGKGLLSPGVGEIGPPVKEEVSGECGRSARVKQNSDGYPDSRCLRVDGALSCNREHTEYEFNKTRPVLFKQGVMV